MLREAMWCACSAMAVLAGFTRNSCNDWVGRSQADATLRRNRARSVNSNVSFPLTPALSFGSPASPEPGRLRILPSIRGTLSTKRVSFAPFFFGGATGAFRPDCNRAEIGQARLLIFGGGCEVF